jgi:hypothetical protein
MSVLLTEGGPAGAGMASPQPKAAKLSGGPNGCSGLHLIGADASVKQYRFLAARSTDQYEGGQRQFTADARGLFPD